MSKRISPEERVLDFFMNAELPVAMSTFAIVKRVLYNRQPPPAPKPPRKRRTKAEIEADKKKFKTDDVPNLMEA